MVATFDYRGIGLSHGGRSLRGFKADIMDWARFDCAAMVESLGQGAPGSPLYWIGHSLGGQILPFVPGRERVTKMVTVTAGSGYWRENSPRLRRVVWLLWYAAVRTPITAFSFTDDETMSARNIESLHSFYSGATRQMKRIAPQELRVARIGHFVFFRRESKDVLWRNQLLRELG